MIGADVEDDSCGVGSNCYVDDGEKLGSLCNALYCTGVSFVWCSLVTLASWFFSLYHSLAVWLRYLGINTLV